MWIFLENLYNANCTPKSFLLRNISRVGIPKSTVLVIIFRVFMWPLSLIDAVPIIIIQFRNGISKYKRSPYEVKMNDGNPLLSSYYEMASKIKKEFVKTFHATFDGKINFNCLSIKINDDDLFKKRSKRPTFVIRPFLTMLNLEVDRGHSR